MTSSWEEKTSRGLWLRPSDSSWGKPPCPAEEARPERRYEGQAFCHRQGTLGEGSKGRKAESVVYTRVTRRVCRPTSFGLRAGGVFVPAKLAATSDARKISGERGGRKRA